MFSLVFCHHSDEITNNNIYDISTLGSEIIFVVAGEACWWTVHPASKQRSEGEKVRVGDDVIFVSVATERYLVGYYVSQAVSTL